MQLRLKRQRWAFRPPRTFRQRFAGNCSGPNLRSGFRTQKEWRPLGFGAGASWGPDRHLGQMLSCAAPVGDETHGSVSEDLFPRRPEPH
eukprot:3764676-Alexandrium_andersonii.AAC.1